MDKGKIKEWGDFIVDVGIYILILGMLAIFVILVAFIIYQLIIA